jgi:hypothetical protein
MEIKTREMNVAVIYVKNGIRSRALPSRKKNEIISKGSSPSRISQILS